jgi:hypothetical protein
MLQRLTWGRCTLCWKASRPQGTLQGFLICILPILPTNRSEVFCHHRTWKHFQKPKRGQRGPPDACPSETEGHTNSGVFLAGTGTGVGIPVALVPHQVAFSDQKSGLCTPKIPYGLSSFSLQDGAPQL